MSNHKQIIFDEYEKAQEILRNGFRNNIINKYELTVLAKYYTSIGITDKKLKETLIEFCRTHLPDFNEIVYRGVLSYAIKNASLYLLKKGLGITITKAEMDVVRLYDKDKAKVLFALLALAKYHKKYPTVIKAKEYNGYYCQKSLKEILRMCKLPSDDKSEQQASYWLDGTMGYASLSEMFTDSWKVLIVKEDSDPEIYIENIDRIMDYFPYYCEKCGKILEKTGKRQKYCKECWADKHRENMKIRMRG